MRRPAFLIGAAIQAVCAVTQAGGAGALGFSFFKLHPRSMYSPLSLGVAAMVLVLLGFAYCSGRSALELWRKS
jgi:hypothetical protein